MRTFRAFGKMLFLLVGTIFILTLEAQSQVVISGPTTACVGQTYTYTATPNYGIYTWTVNGGTFLPTTTNSIQVTWTTSGTHLIGVRWTLFGGGAAALVVRVYDLPVPTITGNIVVCISTGVPAYELYTTEAGMTAYIWSVSAGGTITTGAGTRTIGVTWNTAGTYNVCINYTDANGCAAKTPTCVTVKVIQVPTPTIAGPSIACVGSTGNVYTTQAGNANYIWTVTAGGQQTAGGNSNTMTVTWNTPGTQKVSVSYVEPICGDIEGPVFFTVTVKQNLPVSVSISASPSGTVNAGTSVTFTAIPTNGGSNPSYQWKVNGINVGSGGSTFTSSLLKNGDVVTVVMTSSEMCTSGNPATSNSITMSVLTQTACCPNFNLVDADTICENPDSSCKLTGNNFLTSDKSIIACKNSYHKYTVYPVLTGYSYTWTITGGTPATFTGNSCIILWGSGDPNYIKVVIRNGTCIDSIFRKVCLVDGPNASFTFSPITDCNAPVHFINTSTGGIGYTWDFGDGTTSDLFNPPDHSYANPGTYTVSLTVFSEGIIKFSDSNSMPCGCVDSIMKKVTVPALKNPPIVTPVCCFGTLCPGDTSSSCTTAAGCIYTWSVTGGNIISGAGTACIKVVWGLSYTIPTTVNLSVSGCPGYCTGTTTLHVPVLYSGLPITGPTIVCENSASSFSLPTMPGTFYTWTVTGGAKFNGADRHTPNVSITFPAYPMNCMITCVYNNPLAGCSGSSVLQVAVKTEFKIVWGSDIVCVGDISTYNANGPATWSVTPAGPTINGSGYGTSVTWNTPGSYTLIATPTPGTFCNLNSTMNVTVLADPILGPIIGPVPGIICPGAVTTYSISSNTPGQPFYWIVSGGKPVSTMGAYSDSVIVQWNSAGPYKISVYQEIQPYGCKSLQQSLTVNSYPKPVFTGPSTACVDVPVTYTETAASMPDGSYQWTITPSPSCQGTITSGQGTSSINVIWHGKIGPPGPWTGQINVKTCTGTTSRSVIVKDIPIAVASFIGIPIYCQGENKTFTIQTPYDVLYSYAWFQEFNGNTTSAGTQNSIPIAIQNLTAPGTYRFYVVVTKNGCSYRSNYVDVIILSCTNGLPDIIVPPGPGCSTEAFFIPYIECNRIKFLNFSTPLSSDITYLWTVSALSGGGSGSFDFPNASTPTLTVTKSGNYSIILTVTTISGGCSNAYEQKITVTLPVADFYYTTPVCVGNPELFTAQSTGTGLQYIWNFGDGTTSYKDPTNHSYQIAGIYTVNLKVNDEMGCADQTSKQIEVKPTPVCTITAPDTIFCPGNSVPITACTGMSTYQWFRDGKLISGATTNMFHAVKQGSYWVAATNSYGCETISDTVNIYMERLPVAKITGDEYICTTAGVPPHIHLSTPDSSNYTYQWYKENSGIFTALPGATLSIYDGNGSLPANTTGQYIFSVVVTDKNTLCTASDTICITFSTAPQVHVPYLWGCEGTSFTFSSSDDPGQYDFYWSNGATTQKITTSLPGDYFVSIVDKLTGCCSTPKLAGRIYPKPDLSLFPLGCDTLCDTMHLYVPLALLPGWPDYPNYCPSPYTINWYDNQNYTTSIGTGCKFSLTGLTGLHHISVIVTNNYNCTDTSAIYCPFIKSCTHPQGCKNCCDDFTIKIASVLEKVNSRWIVKSHLTTGPYKLYEIKAAIVNFYMNNQAGCERCITPTMDFGSMMPLAAGSTPTSQINWAPPSGPWVDPVLTHYTTGDLYTSPREFVWHKLNNGQLVPRLPLSNDYVGFQVIIPAVYPNNCCTDTIHFCIRYSFSDTTCRVCDSMKCYTIIQQYPGINSLQIQNENRQNWEIDLQNLEQNKQMMIIPKKNKINK